MRRVVIVTWQHVTEPEATLIAATKKSDIFADCHEGLDKELVQRTSSPLTAC